MKKESRKKITASLELTLIFLSIFAFSYFVSETNEYFENMPRSKPNNLANIILEKITEPMIPIVSATEDEDIIFYGGTLGPFDFEIIEPGCCTDTSSGLKCISLNPGNIHYECTGDFVENVLCKDVPACERGCCFDEKKGIFDSNAYKSDCTKNWTDVASCNIPEARLGCCNLDGSSLYVTKGECETETEVRGIGSIEWTTSLDEGSCIFQNYAEDLGACILPDGACSMTEQSRCFGNFYLGYLCTAEDLNTTCEKTTDTICLENDDRVYFVDTCGNPSNIYDSENLVDEDYWTFVYPPEKSCGYNDDDGNAESKDCGNCDRLLGGMCASASENNAKVDYGDNYCKETGCYVDTNADEREDYVKSGESWCVYEGKIGDGDDTVGSEHYRQVCEYGEVFTEKCGNYRNEICVQNNGLDSSGNIGLRNAECISNNWGNCLLVNSEKEDLEQRCTSEPHCFLDTVSISNDFNFEICLPKYPTGFDLSKDMVEAKSNCATATLECYVPIENTGSGNCEITANAECMGIGFAEEMNDFCRSLGDCGGEVNYVGEYSKSFEVDGEHQGAKANNWRKDDSIKSGKHFETISDSARNILKELSVIVSNQETDDRDYTLYVGKYFLDIDIKNPDKYGYLNEVASGIYTGISGAGGAVILAGVAGVITVGPVGAVFAGAIAGFAAGVIGGYAIAEELGLEPYASSIMAAGFGVLGATAGVLLTVVAIGAEIPGPGWIMAAAAAVIAVIMIFTSLLTRECEDYVVSFECQPWERPIGGDDCSLCDDEEICSRYKCESLGAACYLANAGTEEEICDAIPKDDIPPKISPAFEYSGNSTYEETARGFKVKPKDQDCFDAYQDAVIAISTDEPAKCKYDEEPFDEYILASNFGLNSHVYENFLTYKTMDPTHGEALGLDFSAETSIYVKCQDVWGVENVNFYEIEFCVNQGPDNTAPIVKSVSPENNGLVAYNVTNKTIDFYTNEWAVCRWSTEEEAEFMEMSEDMTVMNAITRPSPKGYWSRATIPIDSPKNIVYISCMDQPWLVPVIDENGAVVYEDEDGNVIFEDENLDGYDDRRNYFRENYQYVLNKPSKQIQIDWIVPKSDFETPIKVSEVEIKVETSGGGNTHMCYWSLSGYDSVLPLDIPSGKKKYSTEILLGPGKKKIYIMCEDELGDAAYNTTEFRISHDGVAPVVTRIWQDTNILKLETNENAKCRYSLEDCKFNFINGTYIGDGESFSTRAIRGETYYIKCRDDFDNEPSTSSCSIQLIAT